jgi:hypothetical protein
LNVNIDLNEIDNLVWGIFLLIFLIVVLSCFLLVNIETRGFY